LPWTADPRAAHGFSPLDGVAPWLPQPADWGRYAADGQVGDDSSMFSLYRRLIAARHEHLDGAGAELLETADDVVVLRRGDVVVACNVGADEADVPAAAGLVPVVTTAPDGALESSAVPGDTTVWFSPRPDAARR
jgi:alpha-glucosidase